MRRARRAEFRGWGATGRCARTAIAMNGDPTPTTPNEHGELDSYLWSLEKE